MFEEPYVHVERVVFIYMNGPTSQTASGHILLSKDLFPFLKGLFYRLFIALTPPNLLQINNVGVVSFTAVILVFFLSF